ncbi:MAG: DUF1648 domain-containing protein [Anaerolineales bacterium]|nr:DUF1648 domain-containing protein [Anaerolineales bacterium]
MVFHPPRGAGLAVAFGGLVVLLLADAALLAVLRANPLALAGFLSLLLLVAGLVPISFLAYRAYGLLRSRYVLSRNAVVVEWGDRRIVLPMALLDEVRAGSEVEAPALRPRGLIWPGSVVGTNTIAGLGEVEFLSAAEKPGQVLLRHADHWLALSPANPTAFLEALLAFRAEGPSVEIEPESVVPVVQRWAVLHDRLALALIGAGGLSVLLLLGYLALVAGQLPPEIALHFDAAGAPDRYGPPTGLLILPVIAGVTWVVNTLLGLLLHRRAAERAAAYLLLAATLFVQALVWVATVGLLTAGNAPPVS